MTPGRGRERSGSELVFGLLKMLMIGYHMWGACSGLELSELPTVLRTTDKTLGVALQYLSREGLVCFDEAAGTVRLSDSGARHLLGTSEA